MKPDIHDDAELHIDQVVVGIREKGRAFQCTGPLRGGVGGRDELRLDLGRCPKSRVVQRCEILFYRPTDRCRIDLFLPLFARDRALTIGVSFNQTCIDREPLTTDQTGLDARSHDALEHTSKNIALAKALIAGTRESRVVGDRVFQAQITEPAIGEVDLN